MESRRAPIQFLLAILIAPGCAVAPAYVAGEPPVAGDPVVVLGADFTHATFADANFRADDLVRGKIPAWSREVTDLLARRLRRFDVSIDQRTAAAQNATIASGEVLVAAHAPVAARSEAERYLREVAPYVDPTADVDAVLVVIDRVTKSDGVTAHTIVFHRATGAIELVGEGAARGDGWGVFDYYNTALHDALVPTIRMVSRAAS
jgi:hypothetical protein